MTLQLCSRLRANASRACEAAACAASAVGAVIGAIAAQKVEMTSMPEMVALFNGSGGIASLMVGWAALYNVGNTTFTDVTILLSILSLEVA